MHSSDHSWLAARFGLRISIPAVLGIALFVSGCGGAQKGPEAEPKASSPPPTETAEAATPRVDTTNANGEKAADAPTAPETERSAPSQSNASARRPADPPPTTVKPADPPPTSVAALDAEYRRAVQAWIDSIDKDDRQAASKLMATENDLKEILTESQLGIIRGHLLPENNLVLKTLMNSAEGQKVTLVRLGEGQIQIPGEPGSGLPVPVVINSRVEITIGDLPVTLDVRRAFRIQSGWKAMEVSIRY